MTDVDIEVDVSLNRTPSFNSEILRILELETFIISDITLNIEINREISLEGNF